MAWNFRVMRVSGAVMERERGLKSVAVLREERKANKFGKPTSSFFLIVGAGIVLVLVAAYFTSNRELETSRSDLLKKQRAAADTVGKEWTPLRDTLESLTLENAREPYAGDQVKPEVLGWDFRTLPGIYFRLRTAQAKDAASLRTAALGSVKDGFSACLLKGGPAPAVDAGAAEERPWNLRQAYAATRVLDDSWTSEVKTAENDMRLRVFQQQYEKAQSAEIPLAIEIVKRAQFFLLVLDEDTDEAKKEADGGVPSNEELQALPHPARVVVVNLKTKEILARLRRTAEGQFFMTGGANVDDETRAAMKRQVNNCALAQLVAAEIVKK